MYEKDKGQKDRSRLIRYILKNPTESYRNLSKILNIPLSSVQRYIKEYRESDNKDPRIMGILSKDLDIVSKWQDIISAKLDNEEEVARMTAAQVSAVTTESARRYELLRWVEKESNETNVTNQAIQVNILFWDEKKGCEGRLVD